MDKQDLVPVNSTGSRLSIPPSGASATSSTCSENSKATSSTSTGSGTTQASRTSTVASSFSTTIVDEGEHLRSLTSFSMGLSTVPSVATASATPPNSLPRTTTYPTATTRRSSPVRGRWMTTRLESERSTHTLDMFPIPEASTASNSPRLVSPQVHGNPEPPAPQFTGVGSADPPATPSALRSRVQSEKGFSTPGPSPLPEPSFVRRGSGPTTMNPSHQEVLDSNNWLRRELSTPATPSTDGYPSSSVDTSSGEFDPSPPRQSKTQLDNHRSPTPHPSESHRHLGAAHQTPTHRIMPPSSATAELVALYRECQSDARPRVHFDPSSSLPAGEQRASSAGSGSVDHPRRPGRVRFAVSSSPSSLDLPLAPNTSHVMQLTPLPPKSRGTSRHSELLAQWLDAASAASAVAGPPPTSNLPAPPPLPPKTTLPLLPQAPQRSNVHHPMRPPPPNLASHGKGAMVNEVPENSSGPASPSRTLTPGTPRNPIFQPLPVASSVPESNTSPFALVLPEADTPSPRAPEPKPGLVQCALRRMRSSKFDLRHEYEGPTPQPTLRHGASGSLLTSTQARAPRTSPRMQPDAPLHPIGPQHSPSSNQPTPRGPTTRPPLNHPQPQASFSSPPSAWSNPSPAAGPSDNTLTTSYPRGPRINSSISSLREWFHAASTRSGPSSR